LPDEDPIAIALMVLGTILMIAAIVIPSQSVEIMLKPLSMIVEATPEGIKIKGTQIDAAVLEFAIGAILFALGWMRRRREL
jgi:Flp pilus assembly protein protease CpaA